MAFDPLQIRMDLDQMRKSRAGRDRDLQLMQQMGALPSPGQEPAPGVPSTFGAPTMQGQVPIPSSAQGQVDREFLSDVARRAESPTDEFARRAIHYWPGGKLVQSVGSWADPLGSRYTRERMQLAEEGGTRELSQQTGVPEWFIRRGKTLATIPAMAAEIEALGPGAAAGFAIPAATQARENAKHYESIGQDQPWTERAQDVMSVLTSYALPEILRGAGTLKQMGKLAGLEGYQALAPTVFEQAPEGGTWGKDVFAPRAKEFLTESLPDTALTVGVMNKSLKKASVPDVGVQPEAPSVLQSQVDLIGKGPRKAAMTYGEFPNEVTLPKGIKTVRLKINNEPVSFAYDPKVVSPHELNMAIAGDKLGTLLGMGVETKADADKVMLAQTPEGKTVNAVAVNETTLPKAQEAAAQQGLSTGPVVEPDQALADRKEQVDRELYGIRPKKASKAEATKPAEEPPVVEPPKEAAATEVIAPATVDVKPDQYGRKPVTRPADARFIDKTGKFLDSAGKSHPEVYTGEYSTPTMENKMLELGDVRTSNMRGEAVAELIYADEPPAAVRASIKKYYEDVLKKHPTVKTVSISMRRSPGFKEIGSREYEELKTDADRASAPEKMVKAIDEFYAKKKEPEPPIESAPVVIGEPTEEGADGPKRYSLSDKPAPKKGMVRLYRVEPKDFGDKGEWLKHHMKPKDFEKFLQERGRLFADNTKVLENYGWGSEERNSYYVDVPQRIANEISREHPDGFTEYLMPEEYLAKKRKIEE